MIDEPRSCGNRLCRLSLAVFFGAAAFLGSCAASPRAADRAAPLWVTDANKAYPDSEWLCVVEQETDAKTAEKAAIARLAQVFRVDLNSVSTANRQFAQAIGNVRKKTFLVSSQSSEMALELVSTSAVSGLVGLQVESWAGRDGRAYANARMNRKECSARYSAMIRENENVIGLLKEEAERNPASFEAFQMLNLAHSVALVTDNLFSLLTVLDPSFASKRPSYGNAEAVNSLAVVCAQAIVIDVKVEGDESGRIAGAFAESINSRGFRTGAGGENPYTLAVSFSLEDVDLGYPLNKFARYVLSGSLKNSSGVEIFSLSDNGREGHLTETEARQRAIRAAERSIGSTGFSSGFDAFVASLL
ncbi:MAG: hypothetical protein FWH38_06375 [Treponema sp.]|nr:hypothetical protein [Treponema sp.]